MEIVLGDSQSSYTRYAHPGFLAENCPAPKTESTAGTTVGSCVE
eukprot:COSAG01_NODE_1856_length_9043_cov_87.168679_5_plen_44_part_00